MDIENIYGSYGGIYNFLFLGILLFLLFLLFYYLKKGQYLASFIIMLFCLPILSRVPLGFTFYTDYHAFVKSSERINLATVVVLVFLLFVRSTVEFRIILRKLRKLKIIFLILMGTLSMALSQFLGLPDTFGFLIGFTKVLQPFLFMIIMAFIFYKYRGKADIIIIWIICSILFAALFAYLTIEQINIEADLVRFGGGPTGSPTMWAAICATWAIVGLANFFNTVEINRKILSGVGFILLGIIIVSTQTRGPLLYFGFGVSLFIILIIFKKTVYSILLSMILALVVLGLFDYVKGVIGLRGIPGIADIMLDPAFVGRTIRNEQALLLFLQNPFVGTPIGYPIIGTPGSPAYEVYFYIYNTPLAWATYGGIICGLSFCAINSIVFFKSVKLAFKTIRPGRDIDLLRNTSLGLLVALFCWFIDFFTTANNLLWGHPFTSVIYYYMILGALVGIDNALEDSQKYQEWVIRRGRDLRVNAHAITHTISAHHLEAG